MELLRPVRVEMIVFGVIQTNGCETIDFSDVKKQKLKCQQVVAPGNMLIEFLTEKRSCQLLSYMVT